MSLPTHLYQAINEQFGRKNLPVLRVGDTVRVHQKVMEGSKERVQVFEGLVIALKNGRGLNGSFTMRKIASGGVAVERVFPLHLPSIVKIDRVKHANVRQAKLYYMRQRAGKGARFTNETSLAESWEEELNKEVGEGTAENVKMEEPAEKEKKDEPAEEKDEPEEKKATKPEDKPEAKKDEPKSESDDKPTEPEEKK